MSNELVFEKVEAKPGSKVFYIKQVKGPSIATFKPDDTISFSRDGTDKERGLTVKFVGASKPNEIKVPPNNSSDSTTAPKTKELLVWKYEVSFENELDEEEVVIPLDPIIVINPGRSSFLIALVVPFAVGVVAAIAAVKLFPGLLG